MAESREGFGGTLATVWVVVPRLVTRLAYSTVVARRVADGHRRIYGDRERRLLRGAFHKARQGLGNTEFNEFPNKELSMYVIEQEKRVTAKVTKRKLPTWFRAKLYEVRTGSAVGVPRYADAGWHLGIHWSEALAYDDEDQIDTLQRELDGSIRTGGIENIIAWLWRWYPDFIRAVPARRRMKLASGFMERVQEYGSNY